MLILLKNCNIPALWLALKAMHTSTAEQGMLQNCKSVEQEHEQRIYFLPWQLKHGQFLLQLLYAHCVIRFLFPRNGHVSAPEMFQL